MENTKRMITCFCGFQSPEGTKFCSECGAELDNIQNITQNTVPSSFTSDQFKPIYGSDPSNPIGVAGVYISPAENSEPDVAEETNDNPPHDKDLKLLIDCCRKTLATGCGDSCDETVLYLDEKTDEYQIHTYYRGFGSYKEIHRGYKTDKSAYDKAMEAIISQGLHEYNIMAEMPMCGGEYVCKFLYEDKIIRLTFSTAPQADLYAIGSILKGFINKENEIFGTPEEN